MIAAIARYELWQLIRSRQFWFVGLVFAAMGYLVMAFSGEVAGGGNINTNAPNNIILFVNLLSIFALFLVASMVASSVIRDFELNSWQVVFSYPISWRSYLLGRFLGTWIAAALCYAFVIPGLIAGAHGPFSSGDVGPFVLGHYLYGYAVFAIPNLFVMSAILFTLSTLSRKSLFAYAGAVLIYVSYNFGYAFINQESMESYIFLVDLFGYSVFTLMTRYWTPFELNTQLVPLVGDLLYNRMIWIGLGGALMALTLARFNPYPRTSKAKGKGDGLPERDTAVARPIAPQIQDAWAIVQQFATRTVLEVRTIVRSVPFFVLLVLGFFNSVAIFNRIDPVFGSPPMPLTRVLVNAVGTGFTAALIIVVTYYAGELVWRERQVRMDQIIDATPVGNASLLVSKLSALWLVVAALLAVTGAAMIGLQLIKGTPVVWGMYLTELAYAGLPFLWISVLAFLCQVLSPNKYLGMLFMVIYMALSMAGSVFFDATTLVVYGTHPLRDASGLANSTFYRLEGLKYDLYWATLSAALTMIVYLFWPRGTDEGLRTRLRRVRQRVTPLQAGATAAALLAFALIGRGLYLEDYVRNPVPPSDDTMEARQVRYEQVMRHLENQPIAMVRSLRLEVDSYIATRHIHSRGHVILENRSDGALEELYVGVPWEAKDAVLTITGARLLEEFPKIRHFRYGVDPPMQPGETRTVEFDLTLDHGEFPGGAVQARLETNGSSGLQVTPVFGYIDNVAISDPDKREKLGLPRKRAVRATLEETWGRQFSELMPYGDYIDFEGIYSVDRGQTAFMGGELIDTWENGGRTYFHYKTGDAPVVVFPTVAQGAYDVIRDHVDGIELAIHYNPADDYHVADFMRTFKFATKYFSDNFGRYPYGEFRIIQIAHGIGANANSGHLNFGEYAGFVSDLSRDTSVDWGTHVIGHEAGHNWWGIMVPSSQTEGSFMLQETLAQYSGLMTLEHTYDRGMVGRFLRYSLKRYHEDRNTSAHAEVPLKRSVQETDYVHYWKGAPVIYGVKELIGEEAFNAALAAYFDEWVFTTGEYPTSLDLIRHIRARTPAEYQDTLTDYFERILMHDLRVTDASVEPTADGRYRVTATISSRKLERTPDGRETPVAIHEPLQIVVVDDSIDSSDRYSAELLADERRWIDHEETVVEFVVDTQPAAVIVDPYHNFIERNLDDNVHRL